MIKPTNAALMMLLLVGIASPPAKAHVTLQTPEAPIGGNYKAVFKLGHGCAGSPVRVLRVRLPAGAVEVHPVAKQGWTIQVINGVWDRSVSHKGAPRNYGVTEVAWQATRGWSAETGDFTIDVTFADGLPSNAALYFPLVQECEKGTERYIEVPKPGQSSDALKFPAPSVTMVPAR
jgi:uncharacterized protein YcnI